MSVRLLLPFFSVNKSLCALYVMKCVIFYLKYTKMRFAAKQALLDPL